MSDEQFRQLCNTFGFAPSRALRELIDCATARAEAQRDALLEALKHAASWFDAAGIDVPASRHVIAAIDKAQQEK